MVITKQKPSQGAAGFFQKHWASSAPVSEILRFGASGIAATVFYFVVVNLLVYAGGLSSVLASMLAYLLALGISYVLQSRIAFRVGSGSAGQILKFVLIALAGLGFTAGMTFLVAQVLHWPALAAAGIVCLLIPVLNYFFFKFWVFAAGNSAQGTREENLRTS